jgi:hypothetical protein
MLGLPASSILIVYLFLLLCHSFIVMHIRHRRQPRWTVSRAMMVFLVMLGLSWTLYLYIYASTTRVVHVRPPTHTDNGIATALSHLLRGGQQQQLRGEDSNHASHSSMVSLQALAASERVFVIDNRDQHERERVVALWSKLSSSFNAAPSMRLTTCMELARHHHHSLQHDRSIDRRLID